MWLLYSCQTNHIKHDGTKFQTSPNQFHHTNKRDEAFFGITHWIPNIQKTSLHSAWTNMQSSKRWSTISPRRHMQHQLTRKRPLTWLLIVRICPQATAHIKNKTLIGTFKCQMLFEGTETMREPQRQLWKERTSKVPLLVKLQDKLSTPIPLGNLE